VPRARGAASKPVIAVIGAGAVGCYYGGRLAQHGFPVHFLFRSGYSNAVSRGLVVKSVRGDFKIPPSRLLAHRSTRTMPKADLVVVTLKTTANDQYKSLIQPLLKSTSIIVTLQNGLGNEEHLAKLFGKDRVVGGLAFTCIYRLNNGTIQHLDYGQIHLGEFSGKQRERTARIAAMFSSSNIDCKVVDDLRYARWEKLVWNIPFNGLGAVLDKTTDKLIATEVGSGLVNRLMLEVMRVAKSLGIHFPANMADKKIAGTRSMGAYQTSMQIDRRAGRPLESRALLYEPLKIARLKKVAVPCLEMLYAMSVLP
jgi:2-dehydropantoate 2-reductase